MPRLRAKIKVRYAMLFCAFGAFGLYTGTHISNQRSLEGGQEMIRNRDVKADFIRRSFTAKWHDRRELLNKASHAKRDINGIGKLVQNPVNKINFAREGNGELIGGDIYANLKTADYDLDEILEEYHIDAFKEEILTTSANNESLFELENTNGKRKRMIAVTYPMPNEDKMNKDGPERVNSNGNKMVNSNQKGQDHNFPKKNDQDVKKRAVGNRHKTHNKNEEKRQNRSQRQKDSDDDEDNDMSKSHRTIFDPKDHVIEYHTLHDDNFVQSLIDKSRKFDTYWASGFPISPEDALLKYGDLLPPWERFEIMHYPKIYYLGLGANKTQLTSNATENFGYDYFIPSEEEGHYKVVVGDHIAYRYEILKFLGSGTFGAVVLARDWSKPSAKNVALKIMHYDENDKYIKRELNIMKLIETKASNHDYFSRLLATFDFRNHKILVLELLGTSLHRRNLGPVKDVSMLKRYAHDILKGLQYLKELNIVHADMKPGNIMYLHGKNNRSDGQLLKVADFGIGCIPKTKEFKCPTYYVQTRYYRAPEVILSLEITPAVDMFSMGVIFSEFWLGTPPFFGETETDHLAAMMEVLGLPPTHMIAKSPRKKIYQRAMCYETESGFKRRPYRKPLTKVLNGMDENFFDLIARCLEFDPKLRITPEEALRHPFLTGQQPKDSLSAPISMRRFLGEI